MEYGKCELCGAEGIVELHHGVYRSQSKVLRDCKLNLFRLDYKCHRGEDGVHGKNGHDTDIKIKKMLQERLFKALDKETYTLEDVAEILEVNKKDVKAACKTLMPVDGHAVERYKTIDIIRKLQGGKLY